MGALGGSEGIGCHRRGHSGVVPGTRGVAFRVGVSGCGIVDNRAFLGPGPVQTVI